MSPSNPARPCPSRVHARLPLILIPCLCLAPSAWAQGALPPSPLEQRQVAKLEAAGLPGAPVSAFVARGVRADHPNSEDVAIYTEAPLDAAAQAEFGARGIRILPGLFIPAVSGHHPYGFQLANVPHQELGFVEAHPLVRGLASAEVPLRGSDDTSSEMVGIAAIRAGECVFPRTGAGVRMGLADSGFDPTSLDLPTPVEAYDVTDGDEVLDWGTDLSGPYSGHGTHVAGVLVGNGFYSGGKYSGGAPGASLYVYKTTNDLDGQNWSADIIKAIERAVEQGVQIFNLSIGTYNQFNDGSDPLEQAVDWAREQGMLVVVAAGNEAQSLGHTEFTLGPGEASPIFQYKITNFFTEPYSEGHRLQVIWRDGQGGDANIRLEATGLGAGESLGEQSYGVSLRDTEAKGYLLEATALPLSQRPVDLQLFNDATDGEPITVHVFRYFGIGGLEPAFSSSTVMSPGLADLALCVGAWTSKEHYTDAAGNIVGIPSAVFDTLASFSSHGPRLDGGAKPAMCAPGVSIVAVLSASATVPVGTLVDDDGVYGAGEAHYSVRNGTSFGSPMVAAAAALLLEAAPQLSADELQEALRLSCPASDSPDQQMGSGLIDAHRALMELTGASCEPLIPSAQFFSLSAGGQVQFRIEAGAVHAGRVYVVLGNFSGTSPGTAIDPSTILPLNPDGYLEQTLTCSGGYPLTLNCGLLDPEGNGAALFELPPGVDPSLAGTVLHHAALILEYEENASWVELLTNTVHMELID